MQEGVAWLHDELPRLVEQGVLTREAADALRRHYGAPVSTGTRARWGQILLASFGALLVGGGLILILAHNWDALGRAARAAVALGTLAAAQGLTLFAVVRRADSPAWLEGTSAFLVAAVGAAIALIGQTYHVGGSFDGLMQAWLWLVVLVPWLTGSVLASVGFWGLLVVRAFGLNWSESTLDLWLLALAGAPFVGFQLRRRPESWASALLAMAAAAAFFIVGSVATLSAHRSGLWAVFQVSFLSAVVAAAAWPPGADSVQPWRSRLLGPASIGLLITGTILSFEDAWPTPPFRSDYWSAHAVISSMVGAGCAAFSMVVTIWLARARQHGTAVATAAGILVVVLLALTFSNLEIGWAVFNLWLLAVGTLTLLQGIRELRLGTANRGLLALAMLVVARFFDTDLSFLVRGIAFVVLGIACFGLNVWLMRRAGERTR